MNTIDLHTVQAIVSSNKRYRVALIILYCIACLQAIGFTLAFIAIFQKPDVSTSNMIIAGGFFLVAGVIVSGLQDMPIITPDDLYILVNEHGETVA